MTTVQGCFLGRLALAAALGLAGAGAALAAAPVLITQPDWSQTPSGEDVVRAFPSEAVKDGVSGQVLLDCRFGVSGRLEQCSVLSETAPQYAFGLAALQLAEHFQARPMSLDGVPVAGAEVRIPIAFRLSVGG